MCVKGFPTSINKEFHSIRTEISGCGERGRGKRDQNLGTMEWNVSTMDQNLGTMERNVSTMDQNLGITDGDIPTLDRSFADGLYFISLSFFGLLLLTSRIRFVLWIIQGVYFPILAIVGVPGKSLFPVILFVI